MKAAEYHEQFAARIIKALAEGTAPWQKPWKAGERILPHNFASGRDYRGGNAVYLAMNGLDRGYADPLHGDPYGAARPRPFRPGHQPGGGRRTPPRRRAEPLRARAGRKGKRDGWRKRRSSVSGCCQPRSSWPATSSCWRMSSGRAGAAALGESGPMQDLKAKIPRVAASPFPVVIEGESGTGKELICGCRRTARSEGSARTAPSGSTCGSWRPPTARSTPRRRPADSAATCCTASRSSGCGFAVLGSRPGTGEAAVAPITPRSGAGRPFREDATEVSAAGCGGARHDGADGAARGAAPRRTPRPTAAGRTAAAKPSRCGEGPAARSRAAGGGSGTGWPCVRMNQPRTRRSRSALGPHSRAASHRPGRPWHNTNMA